MGAAGRYPWRVSGGGRRIWMSASGTASGVLSVGGRGVVDVLSRSCPLIGWYGVDITGPIPVGRGGPGPTTRTPWRKVSLFSQVIPMSAAHKLPSSSSTSACITGWGRVFTGDEPYSLTISERFARALSLAIYSARSWSYKPSEYGPYPVRLRLSPHLMFSPYWWFHSLWSPGLSLVSAMAPPHSVSGRQIQFPDHSWISWAAGFSTMAYASTIRYSVIPQSWPW